MIKVYSRPDIQAESSYAIRLRAFFVFAISLAPALAWSRGPQQGQPTPFEQNAKGAIQVRTPQGFFVNERKLREAQSSMKPEQLKKFEGRTSLAQQIFKKDHAGEAWTPEAGREAFAKLMRQSQSTGEADNTRKETVIDGSKIPAVIEFKK
jgi:hypothetical protein